MKKIFVVTVSLLMTLTAFADNDKPITSDQLPVTAREFIAKYFDGVKISFAKMETELLGKSYEVVFADGCKLEFDRKGEWTDVDCKFTQVPDGIVPQQIKNYVTTNYPDARIIDIDRDTRDYEVALSNGFELKFDLKFNLIDIDN